jgi:hypothetical protein
MEEEKQSVGDVTFDRKDAVYRAGSLFSKRKRLVATV